MNKKIMVSGRSYDMHQVQTNWVFVRSPKTKRTYSVAKIVDGAIVELDNEPALSSVSNQELAGAWLLALAG